MYSRMPFIYGDLQKSAPTHFTDAHTLRWHTRIHTRRQTDTHTHTQTETKTHVYIMCTTAYPDVVLGGHHELVIDHPLGVVSDHTAGVQRNSLIIRDCEVYTTLLRAVSHLHKECRANSLPSCSASYSVVRRACVFGLKTELAVDACQLLSDSVRRCQTLQVNVGVC